MAVLFDQGNLHVIDYFLWQTLALGKEWSNRPRVATEENDFDIETERREGWGYFYR